VSLSFPCLRVILLWRVKINSLNRLSPTLEQPQQAHSSTPLLGTTLAELTAWVQQQGNQLIEGVSCTSGFIKSVRSLTEISVFPKTWRSTVADVPIGRSTLHYRSVWMAHILRLGDGQIIETGIPTEKRLTVRL